MTGDCKTTRRSVAVAALICLGLAGAGHAQEGFVGEIRSFGNNFCPRGWADAAGQLLPISQNDALFSLYGTTYGGDGRTTFGLPDLRGRTNIGTGAGPGLTPAAWGQRAGSEQITLLQTQLPNHSHPMMANDALGTTGNPENGVLAQPHLSNSQGNLYAPDAPNSPMRQNAIQPAGSSMQHDNMAPFLAITWCVALVGIYPSRN